MPVKSKNITLSFNKIKLFGGIIFFVFLLFFIFAIVESELAKKTDAIALAEDIASPTPFLPSHEVPPPYLSETPSLLPTMPRPTVIYEGGDYPTEIPVALPTFPNISPYSLPEGVNPLTGDYPASPALLERRPIASKIALYPRYIRPMAGLSLSDVVFEYYIESGLTRFIAVFYGNDAERIGPVRSGRFFDEHVARMYQSYLVFKYADKRVYDHLKSTDIYKFLVVPGNSACPPFLIGEETRDTYNNIFFNSTKFSACLARQEKDNTRPNLRAGYFTVAPPPSVESVRGIFTRYSLDDYHYWAYDSPNQKYFRYQETNDIRDNKLPNYAPLKDALTHQQVSADNIVFLFVPHTFENQFQEEDEVYHIDLIGSGKAYVFRDGIVLPAYWKRIATDQPLLLTNPNGMPLSLKPGRIFYEVLGENSSYMDKDNLWFFQFETP